MSISRHDSLQHVSLLSSEIKNSAPKQVSTECWRPTYKPRKITNKGAVLVLIISFLVVSEFYLLRRYNRFELDRLWLVAGGITLPIAGWLADTYVKRYKLVCYSILIMWIATLTDSMSSVTAQLVNTYSYVNVKVELVLLVSMAIGMAGFQANVIQFGIDQLHDASSTEITSFIIWYIWTLYGSGIVMDFISDCFNEEYKIFGLLYVSFNLTLALALLLLCNDCLIKEPVVHNPFKLIYRVIKYAIKNKHPRLRSAFTYCEDVLPSRLDLGKMKYGGPFTTEQVEDVKTFIRLIPMAVLGGVMLSHFIMSKSMRQYLSKGSSDSDQHANGFLTGICNESSYGYAIHNSVLILVIAHEIFVYPIFQRCYPQVKSLQKVLLGVIIQVLSMISIIVLESRYGRNSTVHCVFREQEVGITFDYHWIAIYEFLSSVSLLMIGIGSLEFYPPKCHSL